MGVYLYDVRLAVFIFPIIALLITFPVLLWHYHRFGAISSWSMTMIYSFTFYLLCAYFLIVFPLPPLHVVEHLHTIKYNLHPFIFVQEFLKFNPLVISNPHTWVAALKSPTTIQPLFNIFLTLPFGFYLRSYFKRGAWFTVIATFCLSLFFELTQLSGLYGIYPRPYRLFDVDDLMLNTLGGAVGFWLTGLVLPLLPKEKHFLESVPGKAKHVSIFRHGTAFVFDWLILGIPGMLLITFGLQNNWGLIAPLGLIALIWVLPEWFWGQTLGMRLVHLHLTDMTGQRKPGIGSILLRNLYGLLPFYATILLGIVSAFTPRTKLINNTIFFVYAGVMALVCFTFLVDGMIGFFKKDHDFLFERWSKTQLRSTFRNLN